MARIKLMQNNWNFMPIKEDFVKNDAEVLVSRMLCMHVLGSDGNPKMLHYYQICETFNDKKLFNKLLQLMLDFISDIPENEWIEICKQIDIKRNINQE